MTKDRGLILLHLMEPMFNHINFSISRQEAHTSQDYILFIIFFKRDICDRRPHETFQQTTVIMVCKEYVS